MMYPPLPSLFRKMSGRLQNREGKQQMKIMALMALKLVELVGK